METGKSSYAAAKYFGKRDRTTYDDSTFRHWYQKRDQIRSNDDKQRRIKGGGSRPALGALEEILCDEIIELRISKVKVTRKFVADRALELANDAGIALKASNRWLDGFLSRNNFSLRRMTNLTSLSDEELIRRAVAFLIYLQKALPGLDLDNTVLMDESAVYFEDCRTQTVDIQGRRHVVLKSTGYASMRITVILAFTALGKKLPPLLIHKGKSGPITLYNGVASVKQEKAWVDSNLIIKWIDRAFPPLNMSPNKAIVWDSCRAHLSKAVKDHCRKRKINLIVIPGGLTAYLQAGDIGVYKRFKDNMGRIINDWKTGGNMTYTKNGNPKAPSAEIAREWVKKAWQQTEDNVVKNSIAAAGFGNEPEQWHIAKHDVYGKAFVEAWKKQEQNDRDVDLHEENDFPEADDINVLNE